MDSFVSLSWEKHLWFTHSLSPFPFLFFTLVTNKDRKRKKNWLKGKPMPIEEYVEEGIKYKDIEKRSNFQSLRSFLVLYLFFILNEWMKNKWLNRETHAYFSSTWNQEQTVAPKKILSSSSSYMKEKPQEIWCAKWNELVWCVFFLRLVCFTWLYLCVKVYLSGIQVKSNDWDGNWMHFLISSFVFRVFPKKSLLHLLSDWVRCGWIQVYLGLFNMENWMWRWNEMMMVSLSISTQSDRIQKIKKEPTRERNVTKDQSSRYIKIESIDIPNGWMDEEI